MVGNSTTAALPALSAVATIHAMFRCTGQRIKHKRLETLTGKRIMKHIDVGVIGGQTTIPLRSPLRNGTGNGKGRASRHGPIGIGATPGKTALRII